jgi:glutathionylspermidine synthase
MDIISKKKSRKLSPTERFSFKDQAHEIRRELIDKEEHIHQLCLWATEATQEELEEIENYYIKKELLPVLEDLAKNGTVYEVELEDDDTGV